MNRSVRKKMILSFVAVILICAALSSTILYKSYSGYISNSAKDKMVSGAETARLLIDLSDLEALKQTPPDHPQYAEALRKFDAFTRANHFAYCYILQKTPKGFQFVLDSGDFDTSDGDDPTQGTYYEDAPEAFELCMQNNEVVVTEEYTDEWGTFRSAVCPITLQGRPIGVIAVDLMVSDLNSMRNHVIFYTFLSIVVALIIGLSVAVIFSRKIVTPLLQTTTMLKDISQGQGDLTKRLEIVSRDEIGQLSEYFNRFIDQIHHIISQVSSNTSTLYETSESLSRNAGYLKNQSEGMDQTSRNTESTLLETNTILTNIAQNGEEMSQQISSIASAVEQLNATVLEVSGNCARGAELSHDAGAKADAASATMDKLNQSADAIGRVLDTISKIASQTNLLALNATIEAASAGDAGKGFAVVANEVKELARQTGEATKEIAKIVSEIQSNALEAVESNSSIVESVERLNQSVQTIAAAVEEQSTTVSEISSTLTYASDASSEVSRDIHKVSSKMDTISENFKDVTRTSSELNQEAENTDLDSRKVDAIAKSLQELVSKFKL